MGLQKLFLMPIKMYMFRNKTQLVLNICVELILLSSVIVKISIDNHLDLKEMISDHCLMIDGIWNKEKICQKASKFSKELMDKFRLEIGSRICCLSDLKTNTKSIKSCTLIMWLKIIRKLKRWDRSILLNLNLAKVWLNRHLVLNSDYNIILFWNGIQTF